MNDQQRYEGAIALIKSQTNYTEEEAKKKLTEWNGNYMNVIKEYLNPNFNKKKETKKISKNKKIIKGIRNYMDDVAIQYEKRKKMKEELKLQMEIEEEGKKQEELYKTVLQATKQGIKTSTGQKQRMHVLTSLLKLRQICLYPGIIDEFKHLGIPSAKFDFIRDLLINSAGWVLEEPFYQAKSVHKLVKTKIKDFTKNRSLIKIFDY